MLASYFSCSKSPIDPDSTQNEKGEIRVLEKQTAPTQLKTSIKFKGKVSFADGTTYESREETTVELPRHLWATMSTEKEDVGTRTPKEKYTLSFPDTYLDRAYAVFIVYNLPVENTIDTWFHYGTAYVQEPTGNGYNGILSTRCTGSGWNTETGLPCNQYSHVLWINDQHFYYYYTYSNGVIPMVEMIIECRGSYADLDIDDPTVKITGIY